ncbi:MAG: mercury methylation corrinoid protein HgcA [Thermoplasmata archaeon]|nr:mercury methylation corrinoid protein HgcA [Thermoplasmata archaeon]
MQTALKSKPEIIPTTSRLTGRDKWDHFLARCRYRRMSHIVSPGLYSLGSPGPESQIFVSANYTLSFDALRSSLEGIDCYILVLNTYGINVWCAAGKGTFGTEEVIERIELTELKNLVKNKVLILPQLGAPGVCSQEVERRTGFKVEFGPVRARDIKHYLTNGKATPEMRKVNFDIKDRAILIPVELIGLAPYILVLSILFYFISGFWSALAIAAIGISGAVFFPLLLPFLPTKDFTSKGLVLGVVTSIPFAYQSIAWSDEILTYNAISAIAWILLISPWVAYIALNFTGSTTFTSRTGVRREIFRYIPILAVIFISGLILSVLLGIGSYLGWF